MPNVLIVAHAPSANTWAMTQAVARGVADDAFSGVQLRLLAPLDAQPGDVLWAQGLLLGTTENFGYMSGALKDFFDRCYYPCLEQTESLSYALFIRAGNDGLGAKSSVERIVAGLSWKAVQPPLICSGPWRDDFIRQCEELGMTLAAGLEAGIF